MKDWIKEREEDYAGYIGKEEDTCKGSSADINSGILSPTDIRGKRWSEFSWVASGPFALIPQHTDHQMDPSLSQISSWINKYKIEMGRVNKDFLGQSSWL